MFRPARTLSAVAVLLALSACQGQWPDTYLYPKGYTNLDNTPISTPHGYNRSAADEEAVRTELNENADAWRNLVATVLPPVEPALDMNRPVAVVASGGMTPLSASATNYVREMMVRMGYLVSLPEEANQTVDVSAARSPSGDDRITLTLSVIKNGAEIASRSGDGFIPNQVVESMRMPGFTAYPASGPAPAPKPYSNLQQ